MKLIKNTIYGEKYEPIVFYDNNNLFILCLLDF